MDLYILRHGIAEDPTRNGRAADSQRSLTEEGIQKTKEVAIGMMKAEVSFDLILTSPFARALQTAQIVAEKYKMNNTLIIAEPLACGGSPGKLISFINHKCGNQKDILLVGHEPDLSTLISILTAGNDQALFNLKKAGLAKIQVNKLKLGQCGVLEYFLSPKLLIKLSNSRQ